MTDIDQRLDLIEARMDRLARVNEGLTAAWDRSAQQWRELDQHMADSDARLRRLHERHDALLQDLEQFVAEHDGMLAGLLDVARAFARHRADSHGPDMED